MADEWVPKKLKALNEKKAKADNRKARIEKGDDSYGTKLEIENALRKINQLNNEVEKTLHKNGFTHEEVEQTTSNPDNLPPGAFEILQKRLMQLENKLDKAAEKDQRTKDEEAEFKLLKKDQKRRTKSIGSRKKWIQM